MAEFIFKELVRRQGLEGSFTVASSATSTDEIWGGVGNPVYPPAIEELKRNGIPYEKRQAVQLKKSDLSSYDLFVGMDSANVRNMRIILGSEAEEKIHKLMSFTSRGGDVADPWYTDRFDIAYRDIYDGCVALLDKLTT